MRGSVTPRRLDHLLNICPGFDGSLELMEYRQPRLLTAASRIRGHECFEFFETLIFATGDVSSKGSAAEICSADDAYFFRTASTVAVLGFRYHPSFAKPLWLSKGGFWIS